MAAASVGYVSGAFGGGEASRGLFVGADARQFTLLGASFETRTAAAMPGGDVLVVQVGGDGAGRLWRLGLDGRFGQIGSLPGDVRDLAVETPSTVLTLPLGQRRVERYDLATRQVSVVTDLSGLIKKYDELKRLVVLDDGSIVVSDGASAWRLRGDAVDRVVSYGEDVNTIGALAALPGGAFAYVDYRRGALVRVGADGRRQTLVHTGNTPAELASAGDELVAVLMVRADSEGPRTRIIRMSGSRVRQVLTRRAKPPVYGDGDGYGPTGVVLPAVRVLLASDGSLLMLHATERGTRLRALVPQASARLRVALRPSFWQALARGRVDYTASTPGELSLRIRAAGQRGKVTRLQASTSAGEGTLRLRRTLPPGHYDVRLTLSTAGARTSTTARILTTRTLSVRSARSALQRTFNTGEEDGGWNEVSHRCVRRGRGRVACRLMFHGPYPGDTWKTCRGWLVAQLRPDGIRTTGAFCNE